MYLFRIHIRPQGGSGDVAKAFEYCLKNNFLGVGWRLDSEVCNVDWETYIKEASLIYEKHGKSELNVCKHIKKWVNKDDLIWTRDTKGKYYLAQVISGWEYYNSNEAIQNNIDIANIIRVNIHQVKTDYVPGKVVACFRAPKTFQEIASAKSLEYSKHLWNTLSKSNYYKIDKSKFTDVFMMLDDEETEDIVFLYLQSIGWYVVPNSRKADTMSFEYTAVNPKDNKTALTQVKTGESEININDYSKYEEEIYLFQPNDKYVNRLGKTEKIHIIDREDILAFMEKSINWLPKSLRVKYQIVSSP